MHVKLRYALPTAQVGVALGLYYLSERWARAVRPLYDMPGPAPAFTLLVSLNAPLALVRGLYYRHVPEVWDRVLFVAAIACLWYWFALNIEHWRQKRDVFTFHWLPLRVASDLVLFGIGAFWAFVVIDQRMWNVLSLAYEHRGWILCVFTPIVTWSITLMFFFGRDFIRAVRG